MNKFLIAAAVVALSSAPAFAANNTATASGTASATVVAPITLTHTAGKNLNFGAFASAAGSVTVNADSTNSTTGLSLISGATTAADGFTVGGDANRVFDITTTGGTVKNGAISMSFTTSAAATSGTLSAAGAATFAVGGTLTVVGTEAAGAYTGTYTATVTYE